jgi:cobalt/nickel transport system permease protein
MNNRLSHIDCKPEDRSETSPSALLLGSDRSALVVAAFFIFSVLSIPKFNLSEVIVFACFPLFLITAANLPKRVIGKRLLQLLPFVLLLAAGNIFLDLNPMLKLSGIVITGGVISGSVIVAKTLITVASMLSLTLCIPFHRICRALAAFHLPEQLITQLILLYRFGSVLEEEAIAMQRARDIRSFGNRGKGIFQTAPLIGSLLLRTISRAERVYRAMKARGFHGSLPGHTVEKITSGEWMSVGAWGLLFFSLRQIF